MQTSDNQWLSIKEAAQLLNWYPQRLHMFFKPGRQTPPHEIHGGHKVFIAEKIIEWKNSLVDQRSLGNNRKKTP